MNNKYNQHTKMSISEELVREDIKKLNQNSEEIKKLKKDYDKQNKIQPT